jgi:hypothetical protein
MRFRNVVSACVCAPRARDEMVGEGLEGERGGAGRNDFALALHLKTFRPIFLIFGFVTVVRFERFAAAPRPCRAASRYVLYYVH